MKATFPACIVSTWFLLLGASLAHAERCAELKSVAVADAVIASSRLVPAGAAQGGEGSGNSPGTLPEHCEVDGTVAPGIRFELWLPVTGWNGKWQAVGTGGFGGTINTTAMGVALRAGYATAANDTGHRAEDADWMHSRQKIRLWGHESIHRMVQPVARLVRAFYGVPYRKAYFAGCSTGGAQAMEEAQYYPADFDGILAVSPGMAYSHLMLSFLWGKRVAQRHPDGGLSLEKLQWLHQVVLAKCDALDGVADGLLTDPRRCHLDLANLTCRAGDRPDCLTAHQVETVRGLLAGPHDPSTGAAVYPGFYFGSEAAPEYADVAGSQHFGWTLMQGALADRYAIPLLAAMVFSGAPWNPDGFDFDSDVRRVDAALAGVITATDPDLRPFARRGGRLIMVQGWSDPLNPPTLPIEYWENVNRVFASAGGTRADVDAFFRLFMAPGMGHCGLGPGPNEFDAVAALDRWVTTRQAPSSLVATKHMRDDPRAAVIMRRPLCSYPTVAVWDGRGSTTQARSFSCVAPRSHDEPGASSSR